MLQDELPQATAKILQRHGSQTAKAWFSIRIVAGNIRFIVNRLSGTAFLPPFNEVRSKEMQKDYSYLSEFRHPNMMKLSQHYRWTTYIRRTPGPIKSKNAVLNDGTRTGRVFERCRGDQDPNAVPPLIECALVGA
jgi:hypothetical protein